MTKKIIRKMKRIVRKMGRKKYNAIRNILMSFPLGGVLLPPYSFFMK